MLSELQRSKFHIHFTRTVLILSNVVNMSWAAQRIRPKLLYPCLQALSKGPSNSLEIQLSPRSPTIREPPLPIREQPPPRKDAATLTEAGPAVPRGRRHHEGRSHQTEGELDQWERPRGVRTELGSGRDCSDYEEEEELAVQDRRAPRGSQEAGHGDRRGRRYRADR